MPEGTPEDLSTDETVCGLGNRKNELVNDYFASTGVEASSGSNPSELFVLLLSNVREGIGHTTRMFQAQNADVKEALDARIFLSQRVVEKLDECFKLIGETGPPISPPSSVPGSRSMA